MIYPLLIRPLLFQLPAESAHNVALKSAELLGNSRWLASAVHCMARPKPKPVALLGLNFPNPIGLAGGMDKNGVAPLAWWAFGFGFVELGTVTPKEQPGNNPPRMFRYAAEQALVNRMGFNNRGAAALAARLEKQTKHGLRPNFPIGVSVGKNKSTLAEHAADDYADAARAVANQADFLTVNVSSPNTEGLRALQNAQELAKIVCAVRAVSLGKPVLVKLAPELAGEDLRAVLDAAMNEGAAGIIAVNTLSTKSRPKFEVGGLSGEPLRQVALERVVEIRSLLGPSVPLIGCGGISQPEHAQALLDAGANLVQLYTGLVYQGPFLPARISRRLAR